MAGLVRWSVKLGAVGGALYVASTERFFGSTKETADAYGRLTSTLSAEGKKVASSEYVQMLPEAPEVPKELSDGLGTLSDGLGTIREYRRGFKQNWNDGVVFVFSKAAATPEYISGAAFNAKEFVGSQMEAVKEGEDKKVEPDQQGKEKKKSSEEKKAL
jgi:hypothetical protein